MSKVVAVIVTFNRWEKLQKAIETYVKSAVSSIVIVNNASTDGTAVYLETINDERIHILTLQENSGGAGGFHEGMKYVHQTIQDYDWVLVQDDDAFPDVPSLNAFVENSSEKGVDAVISAIYYPTGEICEMNRPGFLPFKDLKQTWTTLTKGNKGFHLGDDYYEDNKKGSVDFASFVGLFLSKRIIQEMGFPDKDWFIYGDDLDYTISFTQRGFSLLFDPDRVFYHDCKSLNAANPNQKTYTDLWRAFFMYRNGIIIYKRLAGKLFAIVFLFKLLSWVWSTRKYPKAKEYLKIVYVAVKDGLLNNRQKKLSEVKQLIS